MSTRNVIAIDLGRRRLRALLAQRDGGILRVRRVVMDEMPASLNVEDPDAVGAWVGEQLRAAGFPRGRATIALSREHVGLKRITLPTTDEYELPEMTRLAMHRELPFDVQTAVIDFVPLVEDDARTTVLAVAVPQTILDHAQRFMKAAKLGVDRVSLRSMGSALLLRHLMSKTGDEHAGSVLAVDITGESVEFCVIEHGIVRFSRAAEALPWDNQDLLADAILTETRRTWMSYRIAEDASDITHAVLMGDPQMAGQLAEPIASMLNVQAEVLKHHPLVSAGAATMDRVWPLAGLLLEPGHGGQTIDFAHPRRAPDRAATRRKRLIMAAGVLVVIFLGLWTAANRHLSALERDAERLEAQRSELFPKYVQLGRDRYRLQHVELWESANVGWLEHLTYLTTMMPGPRELVFDQWAGTLTFRGVEFDRRSREWSAPREITITLAGEARDRAIADRFREALVEAEMYAASSTGADAGDAARGGRRLPVGFTYRLRTQADAPPAEALPHAGAHDAADDEAQP